MPVFAAAAQNRPAYAVRHNLPPLTGTPRQIEWAENIRERLLRGLDRQIRTAPTPARSASFESTRAWLLTRTAASWWIDNRGKKPSTAITARHAEILDVYASLLGNKMPPRRSL